MTRFNLKKNMLNIYRPNLCEKVYKIENCLKIKFFYHLKWKFIYFLGNIWIPFDCLNSQGHSFIYSDVKRVSGTVSGANEHNRCLFECTKKIWIWYLFLVHMSTSHPQSAEVAAVFFSHPPFYCGFEKLKSEWQCSLNADDLFICTSNNLVNYPK